MKRFLAILFLVVLCAPMTLLFSSCGEGGSGDVKTLYVYNWGEYISDGSEGSYDTNAEFEKWYEKTYGEKVKSIIPPTPPMRICTPNSARARRRTT